MGTDIPTDTSGVLCSIRMQRLHLKKSYVIKSEIIETIASMGRKRLRARQFQTRHNKVIFPLGTSIIKVLLQL